MLLFYLKNIFHYLKLNYEQKISTYFNVEFDYIVNFDIFFSCNDNTIKEQEMLTITCTSEDYYNINSLGKIFAKENNIIIKYNILNNDTMKYKLNHNGIDSDLILFDSIIDINSFKELLVDVTTNDYFCNYNSYYKNYFKSNDDRVYVFLRLERYILMF